MGHDYDIDHVKERGFEIDIPGYTNEGMWKIFDDIIRRYSEFVFPYPGAKEVITRVYDYYKVPVYFCTARKKSNRDVTEAWLEQHIGVPFKVGFAGSKHKARHLQKRGYTMFVEDRLRTANHLAETMDKVFLINQPWNINRDTAEGVTRVQHLEDISW